MNGIYVAFEGANGVGKSTIFNAVISELEKSSIKFVRTKEPTESRLGNFVRNEQNTLQGKALACLIASDRIYNIEKNIQPALFEGKLVISDRCIFSAYLYNKMDEVPFEYTASIYKGIIYPDIIFLFCASPATIRNRLGERSGLTRYEYEDSSKELAIIDECESFLQNRGVNIIRFSTEADVQVIVKGVMHALYQHLGIKD